jgi:hypothetical protein
MVAATEAQRRRLASGRPPGPGRWDNAASRFSADPLRPPDANLRAIMEYVQPDDVLLDVGGGAGRYGLQLALQCREVVNVEPSQGMGAAFEAGAKQAGLANARWLQSTWENSAVTGDVALVAHVTYFVPRILPFLEKLNSALRRRAIIATNVTPPGNQMADLFELLHDEPQSPLPGFRELLPALWEMGLVPDVRVLEPAPATSLGGAFATRAEAISFAVAGAAPENRDVKAAELDRRFDEFFYPVPDGFRRKATGDTRLMLITWQTSS